MKIALALLAAFAVAVPVSGWQGPPMPKPPTAELKKIGWMKGNWDAELKMFEGGRQTGVAKGPVGTNETLGGMYFETNFQSDMGGMNMQGLQLTSWDSSKKQYVAYWFDSMGVGVLELRGTLKNGVLIMTSKPTSFPGMPGKMAFRSTNAMRGANKMLFRLEMNMGQGWGKMLEGTMTRK